MAVITGVDPADVDPNLLPPEETPPPASPSPSVPTGPITSALLKPLNDFGVANLGFDHNNPPPSVTGDQNKTLLDDWHTSIIDQDIASNPDHYEQAAAHLGAVQQAQQSPSDGVGEGLSPQDLSKLAYSTKLAATGEIEQPDVPAPELPKAISPLAYKAPAGPPTDQEALNLTKNVTTDPNTARSLWGLIQNMTPENQKFSLEQYTNNLTNGPRSDPNLAQRQADWLKNYHIAAGVLPPELQAQQDQAFQAEKAGIQLPFRASDIIQAPLNNQTYAWLKFLDSLQEISTPTAAVGATAQMASPDLKTAILGAMGFPADVAKTLVGTVGGDKFLQDVAANGIYFMIPGTGELSLAAKAGGTAAAVGAGYAAPEVSKLTGAPVWLTSLALNAALIPIGMKVAGGVEAAMGGAPPEARPFVIATKPEELPGVAKELSLGLPTIARPTVAEQAMQTATRLTEKFITPEQAKIDLTKAGSVITAPETAYNGAGQAFRVFAEGAPDPTALYGPGVYLTDSSPVSRGYAITRAKQIKLRNKESPYVSFQEGDKKPLPEAVVNTVSLDPNQRLLNLEKPLPKDAASSIVGLSRKANSENWWDVDAWQAAEDAIGEGKSGKEIYSDFKRGFPEGTPSYEVGESLQLFNDALKNSGYDGLAHIGGKVTGGVPHNVTILFDENKAKIITPETRALVVRPKLYVYSNLTPTEATAVMKGNRDRPVWTVTDANDVKVQGIEGSGVLAFEVKEGAKPVQGAKIKGAATYRPEDLQPVGWLDEKNMFDPETIDRARPILDNPKAATSPFLDALIGGEFGGVKLTIPAIKELASHINPAADLQPLDTYLNEIKQGVPTSPVGRAMGLLVQALGINPMALANDPISQITLASVRMRMDGEALAHAQVAAVTDAYRGRILGLSNLFDTNKEGLLKVVTKAGKAGEVPWNDVYEHYTDYKLDPTQVQAIKEARALIRGVNDLKRAHGLPTGPDNFSEDGYGYMPRQVKGVRGIETLRPSKPSLPRDYETALEGAMQGVQYDPSPRDTMLLHVRVAYQQVADAEIKSALQEYSIAPSKLVPVEVIEKAKDAAKNLNAAQATYRALQRDRIRLQTGKAESQLMTSLRQRRFDTLDEVKAGIADQRNLVSQFVKVRDFFKAKNDPALPSIVQQLADARETVRVMMDYRARVQAGREVLGQNIAGVVVDQRRDARLAALAQNKIDVGTANSSIADAKKTFGNAKAAYSAAVKQAQNEFRADAGLFPQSTVTGDIPVQKWGNRFFPKGDAEILQKRVGNFLGESQNYGRTQNALIKAFYSIGNAQRFLALFAHFNAPMVHGLPTLFTDPAAWAKGSLGQYAAAFDPTFQAQYIRNHLESIQEMITKGHIQPSGSDFFSGEGRGVFSDVSGQLEKLPHGAGAAKVLDMIANQTYGRSATAYGTSLLLYRNQLWEGLRNSYVGNEAGLGQLIRNMTGALDTRFLGATAAQRAIESMWMSFSPRLLRSSAAMMADAVRGAAGGALTTGALRGSFLSMTSMISGVMGLYVLTGLALKRGHDEILQGLNPLGGKKFLSYQIGNAWYGAPSEFRAILQLAANMAGSSPEDFVGATQKNPLVQFWTSRGSPGFTLASKVSAAIPGAPKHLDPFENATNLQQALKEEIAQAQPFGLKILNQEGWGADQGLYPALAITFGIRSSVSMAADQMTALREETMGNLAKDIMATTQNIPEMATVLQNDPNLAQTLQGLYQNMTYYELGSGERSLVDQLIVKAHPELQQAYDDKRLQYGDIFATVAKTADDKRTEYNDKYDKLWKSLLAGTTDPATAKNALDDLKNQEAGALDVLYSSKEYQDSVNRLRPSDIRVQEDVWNQIIANDKKPDGVTTDWDKVDVDQTKFIQDLMKADPNMAQRLMTDLALKESLSKHQKPEILQFQKDVDNQLTPYFSLVKPDGSADTAARAAWLNQNPPTNAMAWVLYGTALQSPTAVDIALSMDIPRAKVNGKQYGVKLAGSSTVITPQNQAIFDRYSKQIETLLNTPGETYLGGRLYSYPRDLLKEEDPLYDALSYWLGFSSPEMIGLSKGKVAVYNPGAIQNYLNQWGVKRDDGAGMWPRRPTRPIVTKSR